MLSDAESDVKRRNVWGRVLDIDLLRAALETHRAPIHTLRNGKGVWNLGCCVLHKYDQAADHRQ